MSERDYVGLHRLTRLHRTNIEQHVELEALRHRLPRPRHSTESGAASLRLLSPPVELDRLYVRLRVLRHRQYLARLHPSQQIARARLAPARRYIAPRLVTD